MDIKTPTRVWHSQPQMFYKLARLREEVLVEIKNASSEWACEFWQVDSIDFDDRVNQWIDVIVEEVTEDKEEIKEMLIDIFK